VQKPRLCVKLNSFPSPVTCPLCEQRIKTLLGPEVFIEGTGQIVCPRCSTPRAPELVALVRMVAAGM
jgi:uncharacterized Zn-finger protein